MRWPLTENQCTALLMVVEWNTLYEREWSRAELIGSSRTFQRGNDSVCTDPSFTSVQVESRLYNRKSFRRYLPLSFSHFVAIFSQEWVIPLTFTSWRVVRSRRLDPTLYCTHRDNNIPTLLLFRVNARRIISSRLGSSINYLINTIIYVNMLLLVSA